MLISIITVTRNDFEGLNRTVNSLKQIGPEFRDCFEHIIVDGLSTDQTMNYLNEYCKTPVLQTVLTSEQDSGIYDAMNKGVSKSNGSFCFFLNSGDLIDSNVDFNGLLEILKENIKVVSWAGVAMNVKISNGNSFHKVKSREVKLRRLRMPTIHQGIIYKTTYLFNNKYDDTLKICGDFKSVVVALEQSLFFKSVNAEFTVLTYGGISSQKPFLLLSESLLIILNSSVNVFYKLFSCTIIITNVFLFQVYFRVVSLIKRWWE